MKRFGQSYSSDGLIFWTGGKGGNGEDVAEAAQVELDPFNLVNPVNPVKKFLDRIYRILNPEKSPPD
jgi:hypothetical protein